MPGELGCEPQPRFTQWVVENRLLESPIVLADAGVQGGISPRWNHLGEFLTAYGFDPLEEIVEALMTKAPKNHHYIAKALGDEIGTRDFYVADEKTASSMYAKAPNTYAVDPSVETTAEIRQVRVTKLDALPEAIDVIKVDVEGFEPEVLKGAQRQIAENVIAVEVETNFNVSPVHPRSHFCTICDLLIPHGFTLFDLSFDRIPRKSFVDAAKLARLFVPKTRARPATVNALFYRDVPAQNRDEAFKRAVILELYGLSDTAFDVIDRNVVLVHPWDFFAKFFA